MKAGARKVYAVEASEMAGPLKSIVDANGAADVIEVWTARRKSQLQFVRHLDHSATALFKKFPFIRFNLFHLDLGVEEIHVVFFLL